MKEWSGCADICSLVTEVGPEGATWSCIKGGSGSRLGKDSSPEGGWAMEQAHLGSGHGPALLDSGDVWTLLSDKVLYAG